MRRAGDVWKVGCLWAMLLLALLSGCASHVQQLREAQDEFNRAASLENQMRLDPRKADAASLGNVAASYRVALRGLTDLMENKGQELEKDKLIGVAATLRALTEWRLGDYAAAVQTADSAKDYPEGTLYHRDRLLLMAMTSLVKNDQAFKLMTDKAGSYEQIRTLLTEALQGIGEIMPALSPGEDLRVYLSMARLGVLKNWQDLRSGSGIPRPASFSAVEERKAWCLGLRPAWEDFEEEMKRSPSREAQDLASWWGARLNPKEFCPNE